MTDLANLDIVYACSWRWGGVRESAQGDYIAHIQQDEEKGIKDNLYTPNLPAISGPGAIFWKVSYPQADGYPSGDYPFSTVQTTLLDDMQINPKNITINYDPSLLINSPFQPVNGADLVICAAYWGSSDLTMQVQNGLQASISKNQNSMNFRMSQYGKPGSGPTDLVCVVYAYIRQFANSQSRAQFFGYSGPETNPITLSLSRPRQLTIFAATFGIQDVTPLVQRLITGQQTVTIDTATLRKRFKVSAPGLPTSMVLSIMYQYEGGDMQFWAGQENTGIMNLTVPSSTVSLPITQKVRHPRAGEPNILALIWGDGSKVDVNHPAWPWAEVQNDALFTAMQFTPSVAYFGGAPNDPMSGITKSCHVYYSYGTTGIVRSAAAFEGQTLALVDRDLELIDPLPAKGVLSPAGPEPCFIIHSTSTGKYYSLVSGPHGYQLSATTDSTQAAVLQFVRLDPNDPTSIRMLKAFERTSKQWLYLCPQSGWGSWIPSVPQTAVFNTASGLSPLGSNAFTFNYEIPSGVDSQGLVLCVSRTTDATQTNLYTTGVQALHESSAGLIELVHYSNMVSNVTDYLFIPDFVADPSQVQTPRNTSVSSSLPTIEPCTKDTFNLIYILGYGGVIYILPYLRSPTWLSNIVNFFNSISAAAKAKISTYLTSLQAFFRIVSTGGNSSSGTLTSVWQFVKKAFEFVRVLWGENKIFWNFLKQAFFPSYNYWHLVKQALEIAIYAVKMISGPAALAIVLLQYAIWCIDFKEAGDNVIRSCLASLQTTPAAKARALAMERTLVKVQRTAEKRKLSPDEQFDLIHALSSPTAERLFAGTEASAPELHPLVDFHEARDSATGLKQRHIRDSHTDLYRRVTPQAVEVAKIYGPELQQVLLKETAIENHE